MRREGGRKPAARWNSSWRVPSSVPASAPGQLVRHTRQLRRRRSGRKSGLAATCTAPRPEPAASGSRPPTCKNTPPPALTPSLHSLPPLGPLLVPNRTCRTPPTPAPRSSLHLPSLRSIFLPPSKPGAWPRAFSLPVIKSQRLFLQNNDSNCQGPEVPPLHLPSGCLQTSPWIPSLAPPPSLIHFSHCFQEPVEAQGDPSGGKPHISSVQQAKGAWAGE